MLLELKAVYSNQKGFYGKACVHEVNSYIIDLYSYIIDLYSYDTLVCSVNRATHTIALREQWDRSNTTLRHVREFLAQCCDERFAHASKRQLIAAVRSGREMHGWPIVLG